MLHVCSGGCCSAVAQGTFLRQTQGGDTRHLPGPDTCLPPAHMGSFSGCRLFWEPRTPEGGCWGG